VNKEERKRKSREIRRKRDRRRKRIKKTKKKSISEYYVKRNPIQDDVKEISDTKTEKKNVY